MLVIITNVSPKIFVYSLSHGRYLKKKITQFSQSAMSVPISVTNFGYKNLIKLERLLRYAKRNYNSCLMPTTRIIYSQSKNVTNLFWSLFTILTP